MDGVSNLVEMVRNRLVSVVFYVSQMFLEAGVEGATRFADVEFGTFGAMNNVHDVLIDWVCFGRGNACMICVTVHSSCCCVYGFVLWYCKVWKESYHGHMTIGCYQGISNVRLMVFFLRVLRFSHSFPGMFGTGFSLFFFQGRTLPRAYFLFFLHHL